MKCEWCESSIYWYCEFFDQCVGSIIGSGLQLWALADTHTPLFAIHVSVLLTIITTATTHPSPFPSDIEKSPWMADSATKDSLSLAPLTSARVEGECDSVPMGICGCSHWAMSANHVLFLPTKCDASFPFPFRVHGFFILLPLVSRVTMAANVTTVIRSYHERLKGLRCVPATAYKRAAIGEHGVANKVFLAFLFAEKEAGIQVRFLCFCALAPLCRWVC